MFYKEVKENLRTGKKKLWEKLSQFFAEFYVHKLETLDQMGHF